MPKRVKRTAPEEFTALFFKYLEEYLKNKKNRQVAVMGLLRCSKRTAAELTNRKKPYARAIRRAWIYLLCAALGRPPSVILRLSYAEDSLQCWYKDTPGAEAIRSALNMSQTITLRALDFGLSGVASLHHYAGKPDRLEFWLSPLPSPLFVEVKYRPHMLWVTRDVSRKGLSFKHITPDGTHVATFSVSLTNLDKILYSIYEHCRPLEKNFTTDKK